MKIGILALIAMMGCPAALAEPPSLVFPERQIDLPGLSLHDLAAETQRSWLNEALARQPQTTKEARSARSLTSKMPVVKPPVELDAKLRIQPPDTKRHYSLTIVAPEVDSVE